MSKKTTETGVIPKPRCPVELLVYLRRTNPKDKGRVWENTFEKEVQIEHELGRRSRQTRDKKTGWKPTTQASEVIFEFELKGFGTFNPENVKRF